MHSSTRYLTAEQAAEALGIQLASLYAYVSRGLLNSEPAPDDPRARRYLAEDVQRLQRRQVARRDPTQAIEPPLAWGIPVLDSEITLIDQGRFYYRGYDVPTLAAQRSIEEVASLLWTGDFNAFPALPGLSNNNMPLQQNPPESEADPITALLTLLLRLSADDLNAYDLRPVTVMRQGATVLQHLVAFVSAQSDPELPIAVNLQRHWAPEHTDMVRLLDAALILCADHELNASSFTVRCIASTRAPLYAALTGGLSALAGTRHGGATLAVEALVEEIERGGDVQQVLSRRLRRGEHLPGFGHRIYPDGDPRAAELMRMFEQIAPDSAAVGLARSIADSALALTGQAPQLELALVTLANILRAPSGTALTVMALGRTVGWVAHALEEYRRNELIRPRARYTGPAPH